MLVQVGAGYAQPFAMSARLEVVREDLNSTRSVDRGKLGSLVKMGLVLAGIALAILLLMWSDGSEGRAIHSMPPSERQALLSRTLETLKSVCAEPDTAMRDFCGSQARLALEFPECGEVCQGLARQQLSRVQPPR